MQQRIISLDYLTFCSINKSLNSISGVKRDRKNSRGVDVCNNELIPIIHIQEKNSKLVNYTIYIYK